MRVNGTDILTLQSSDKLSHVRSRKEVFPEYYLAFSLRQGRAAQTPLSGFSRKEVFQPHLPVRLPCYDLAPITSFALDRFDLSLQAPPAFMA